MIIQRKPFLSFCIFTYNNENELRATLESIIPQALDCKEDIEIVISDNCSQDGTKELVESFRNKYMPIVYNRNEQNIGPGKNLFKALELASGDFVWLMGDDEILPGALQHVVSAIKWAGSPYPSDTFVNWIHQWPDSYKGNRPIWEARTNDKVKNDIILNDVESYLRLRAPYFPVISAHIFDRKLIDLNSLKPFFETNWPQVYMLLHSLKKNPRSLHIARPCLLDKVPVNRTIKADPWPEGIFTKQLANIFKHAIESDIISESLATDIIFNCYQYIFCDPVSFRSLLSYKWCAYEKKEAFDIHKMIYEILLSNSSSINRTLIKSTPVRLIRFIKKVKGQPR